MIYKKGLFYKPRELHKSPSNSRATTTSNRESSKTGDRFEQVRQNHSPCTQRHLHLVNTIRIKYVMGDETLLQVPNFYSTDQMSAA